MAAANNVLIVGAGIVGQSLAFGLVSVGGKFYPLSNTLFKRKHDARTILF